MNENELNKDRAETIEMAMKKKSVYDAVYAPLRCVLGIEPDKIPGGGSKLLEIAYLIGEKFSSKIDSSAQTEWDISSKTIVNYKVDTLETVSRRVIERLERNLEDLGLNLSDIAQEYEILQNIVNRIIGEEFNNSRHRS